MPQTVIHNPAGYMPGVAIGFGTAEGPATAVDAGNPLPTRATMLAAATPPLAGSLSASGAAGPFAPELGRPIRLVLSGAWTGTAQLLRSTDGGATRLPLTYGDGSPKGSWTGNLNATVAEESVAGASYWLAVTLASGTLSYRVEQ